MGHKIEQSLVNSRIDFFYYAFRNILLVSIPLLVVSGIVLSHLSFHSSATGSSSGSDNLAITISSSCTLSSVVNIPHNAEVYNGNYLGDIGKTTIKTLCNDGNGYSVYAVGYSNNEEGNNRLINSEYPQYSIDTGLNTSGLTSQWAMKLNNIPDDPSPTPPTIESDYNNTYGLVPNYWTKVASRASGTTDMAEGSSFTTTYAVYASSSQYAGTYQGQVKYMLVHPAYQRPPMRYMQDVADWEDQLGMEESVQAIDMRDGKKYWVTKLLDGHIWMTQNLDLDLIADRTYTHNDTDLGWDPNSFNVNASWTLTGGPSTISWDSTSSAYPGWQNSDSLPYSADPGDKYHYTSGSTEDDNVYSSLSECINAGHADCAHYSVGNYYNFTSAIASNNSASLTSGNAPNSICPAGWRLPSASYNDFGILLKDYNITTSVTGTGDNGQTNYASEGLNKIRTSPLYFVRSSFTNGSGNGAYLYNAVINSGYNRRLNFNNNTVSLTNATYRYSAYSIRCIAR